MRITILTLFPEMFEALNYSILKRAKDKGLIDLEIVNIRDFSKDKHKKTDDYTYGGGAGMLMTAQPICDAFKAVKSENSYNIYVSAKGKKFSADMAKDFSKKEHIIILCGHYEGVDQRALDICGFNEVSIGDYVLTGGELPAMVIIDCVSRFIDGVISGESLDEESFSNGLLEYPQYTRPQIYEGLEVPEVLISGNHEQIKKWREEESSKLTKEKRNDLLKK